ncbi:MAG: sulfite exporter TauE/SafE family protein [Candidatus Bathyarchaeota archaeon]|nr:sulfite exporter TauE/SafE family protein [Candidatus Bathyarchaeota archaeon]MDH5623383.1 sulfite exporter TauE/SafE family protein [Candidatus Bathyarchaeota archaeon]MDH5701778.1 sulfite exporter TauE/SafE family protein [Candidatus Bathyarchaeota archaeon]
MIPFDMALLSPIAFLVGIIAAMTGVGGGVFVVPLLSLVYGFSSHQAIGTSLATIVFTSLSSTIVYWRQRRVDYKVGLILTLTTIPGAFVGAYLTSFIEEKLLGLIFGFFLIFVALRMAFQLDLYRIHFPRIGKIWHRKIVDSGGTIFEYDTDVNLGLVLSFFGGLSSGLLGIGGGALMVPILHLTMNFPMHVTVATSMFIMVFTSISGAATHFSLGNVDISHAVFLCIGVILGAQVGAYFSKKISGKDLRRMFGVVLFLVSIRMILKFI